MTTKRTRRHKVHPTGRCSIPGCKRRHHARGLCGMHLQRERRGTGVGTRELRVGFGEKFADDGKLLRKVRRLVELDTTGEGLDVDAATRQRTSVKSEVGRATLTITTLNALERRGWVRKFRRNHHGADAVAVTEKGRAAVAVKA